MVNIHKKGFVLNDILTYYLYGDEFCVYTLKLEMSVTNHTLAKSAYIYIQNNTDLWLKKL